MAHAAYRAEAIHCEGCAGAIKRSLGKLPGVEAVEVNVAQCRVDVEYDAARATAAAIEDRLAAAGYPAQHLDG